MSFQTQNLWDTALAVNSVDKTTGFQLAHEAIFDD
jgi:hypothetical protein